MGMSPLNIDSLTPIWQWVGLIVAILALVIAIIALQPLVQVIWGRPRFNTRFEHDQEGLIRFLIVHLENLPIRSRFLKLLGIRRQPIHSVTANYQLKEVGSGIIVIPIRQLLINTDDTTDTLGTMRIELPATYGVAAAAMFVLWNEDEKGVQLAPSRVGEEGQIIKPGYYEAIFNFNIDGEPTLMSRRFRVGEEREMLFWAKE